MQGPARSAVATKEDAQKKENKPAPEETEDVYYSRSSGLPLKFLDTTAKSKSLPYVPHSDTVLQFEQSAVSKPKASMIDSCTRSQQTFHLGPITEHL